MTPADRAALAQSIALALHTALQPLQQELTAVKAENAALAARVLDLEATVSALREPQPQ